MTSSPRFKLITGDCIEVLERANEATVDLVVTDPPYLVNYRDRSDRRIANDRDGAWLLPAFEQIARILKPDSFCVSFYGWNHAEQFLLAWKQVGLLPVGHLAFAKAYASNRRGHLRATHENAYLLAKGSPQARERLNDVLPWSYSGNDLHPTQKPVSALEPLVAAFSSPGDTVLDPFCGSGSTGQAALLHGRDFLGIELEKAYVQVARERLARFGTEVR